MAAAVMPLIAQNYVDSRSNTSFDLIVNLDVNNNKDNSPRQASKQRQIATLPSRAVREKAQQGGNSRSPLREQVYEQQRKEAEAHRAAIRRAEADNIYNWPDDRMKETFCFEREVGYGNWGSLWLSYIEPERETAVALKMVHRTKDTTSAARVKALWNEYKCMRALRPTAHPNLIAFHAFILTPSFATVHMDYHPSIITIKVSESRGKVYARQLLSAVEHLHVHGITHNDIKPANILLSKDDRPVLIDFGFAQQWNLHSPDRFLSTLSWGTVEYLAPERISAQLHDERLSDIWALGITLYELVVGRTPFERTEDEAFLDRGQLEVYYQRTLTGGFYGNYLISRDFESLIRLMVEVNPHLRLQSCGKALQHRYFDIPQPKPVATPPSFSASTPPRKAGAALRSHSKTPTSSVKKPQRSPQRKKEQTGFTVYQDENEPTLSPARNGGSVSPFSPRSGALTNLTNQSPSRVDSTPPRSKIDSPLKTVTSPLAKKAPPPSRIPVRKVKVASPPAVRTQYIKPSPQKKQFIADDSEPVPPLPISASPSPPRPEVSVDKPSNESPSNLARSTSITSVRRKPVPALFDESFDLAGRSLSTSKMGNEQSEEEEILSSNRLSPVIFDMPESSELPSSISSKTSQFLKRSFSKRTSSLNRSTSSMPIFTKEIAFPKSSKSPSPRQLSKSVSTRIRKLSIPLETLSRPSVSTLAGLKHSISSLTRRRGSTDSAYSFIEAEPLRSSTTPIRARAPAHVDAEAQRIRLKAFSSHVQHILEVRNSLDTSRNAAAETVRERHSSKSSIAESSSSPNSNVTVPLDSNEEASILSTPRRDRPRDSPKHSPRKSRSPTSKKTKTPSPPVVQGFKPGHRRIPTAIRNVPSVVLHESGDDGELEVEAQRSPNGYSSARIASPPPPPRVVEPSRQLPTWVVDESDEEDDENLADVDEPTITIGMTPLAGKSTRVSSLGSKKSTSESNAVANSKSLIKALHTVSIGDQRVESPKKLVIDTSSPVQTPFSPSSPIPADLPFRNLESRSDSRTSTTHRSQHGHSRSRSVISFFTRSTTSLATVSSATSDNWTTSTKVTLEGNGSKVKKMGRIRRVVSKVFR